MSANEDIRNNLAKYEKFRGGKPEKIMLYHKLKLENLKIIGDKTNYLDMDIAKIPIVEFVCDKCNQPIENRQQPFKVDFDVYKLQHSFSLIFTISMNNKIGYTTCQTKFVRFIQSYSMCH